MRRVSKSAYIDIGSLILPRELAEDVQLLLRDPLTGRTRYGELRRLTIQLFANWVDEQRSRHPRTPDLIRAAADLGPKDTTQ
jgi:hypothetical protein